MDNPLRVVRELKGAGVLTLIALGMQREPAKRAWIEGAVGLSDKTITRALDYLHASGYVRPVDGGWKLTREGASLLKQLSPVCEETGQESEAGASVVEDDPGSGSGPERGEQADCCSPRPAGDRFNAAPRKNSGEPGFDPVKPVEKATCQDGQAPPRNFSGLCCFNESIDSRSESIDREKQKQRACDPEKFRPGHDPGGLRAIWKELRLAGIRHNSRTEALARQPGMTADYIRAHRLHMQKEGQVGERWTGLLITILERGEPAPEQAETIICRICHQYPCACEAEVEEWEEDWEEVGEEALRLRKPNLELA